jgi:hypothetical protein
VAKTFRLTSPVAPEDSLHKTAADLLDRWLMLPAVWTTFPAGGYELGPAAAGRLKRLGMKPGMPDIMVWRPGHCMGIELKTEKGRLSKAQKERLPLLEGCGIPVYVARTPEAVLDALLRERMPVQRTIVKAMLDRPYVRAERPIEDKDYENQPRQETFRSQESAQGPRAA